MFPESETIIAQIAAARAGSSTAAGSLLARYQPWLRVLATSQMESRFSAKFDASDILQQTCLQAVRDLPTFRGTTEPELMAWLRQILCHTLAHEIRRYAGTQKRCLQKEVSLDQELSDVSQRLGDLIPASGPTPSQNAATTDRQVQLARILDRLPPDYRTILVLRHLEGLTHEAIAERMQRNPGAIRMLWVRALARLRHEVTAELSA